MMQGNIGNSAQMMSHDIHIHQKTATSPPMEWTINDAQDMLVKSKTYSTIFKDITP